MVNVDEDALICDLAETYQIFDYRSLPCRTVAIFSCGLRNNSRIKMKMSGMEVTDEEMLLAAIVDNTKLIAWLLSKDGSEGNNRPKSILAELMNQVAGEKEIITFASGQKFDDEWRRLTGGKR